MQAEYSDVPFQGPPRSYNDPDPKRYIVIHNTANDASPTDEASYARNRTDGVSSHYYVGSPKDSPSLIQSLTTDYGANHVGSSTGNDYGIAYEITGTNSKSYDWWMANVDWPKLCRQIGRDCAKWGITPQTLSISQMKYGKTSGIVTHDQARQAWGYTSHTDPGPNFPMSYLIDGIKQYMEDGEMSYADDVWKYNFGSSQNPRYAIDVLKDAANAPSNSEVQDMITAATAGLMTKDQADQLLAAIAQLTTAVESNTGAAGDYDGVMTLTRRVES